MTSHRDRPPLSVRPPSAAPAVLPDLPPISALFLIDFDVKAGYTIVWKQAVPGLELEGVVEYKSLPSGLHTVSEDLIYFIHDGGFAGLSAFVNAPTDEEETRHSRMIAVGVLVPLSYGRLGRSWRHAEGLREMAQKLAADRKAMHILEDYWAGNRAPDTTSDVEPLKDSPLSSPSATFQSVSTARGHARKRSASDGNVLIPPGHRLSPFHPAWSLTALLETFGPLIFPIHRAALLRKRILISTVAPVHEVCNYVYDISVLSNIPLSIFELLNPSAPAQRLRPLFTIGVHDIPFLIEDQAAAAAKRRRRGGRSGDGGQSYDEAGSGWVACTTDSILAMKADLWDMLITMPPPHASGARERAWPTVEMRGGLRIRATQRDLRRFRNMTSGLARLAAAGSSAPTVAFDGISSPWSGSRNLSANPEQPPILARPGTSSGGSIVQSREPLCADEAETVVEPITWAALAYSGFMWWASAGEQRRSEESEEASHDSSLLADLLAPSLQRRPSTGGGHSGPSGGGRTAAVMSESVMSLPGGRDGGADAAVEAQQRRAQSDEEERARVELAIIAYFRRLTTQILAVLADIVESGDDDSDDDLLMASTEDSDGPEDALLRGAGGNGDGTSGGSHDGLAGSVAVDSDALARMGLDVWSAADVEFVKEVTARYFARRAWVESKGVEVCGLRVC